MPSSKSQGTKPLLFGLVGDSEVFSDGSMAVENHRQGAAHEKPLKGLVGYILFVMKG